MPAPFPDLAAPSFAGRQDRGHHQSGRTEATIERRARSTVSSSPRPRLPPVVETEIGTEADDDIDFAARLDALTVAPAVVVPPFPSEVWEAEPIEPAGREAGPAEVAPEPIAEPSRSPSPSRSPQRAGRQPSRSPRPSRSAADAPETEPDGTTVADLAAAAIVADAADARPEGSEADRAVSLRRVPTGPGPQRRAGRLRARTDRRAARCSSRRRRGHVAERGARGRAELTPRSRPWPSPSPRRSPSRRPSLPPRSHSRARARRRARGRARQVAEPEVVAEADVAEPERRPPSRRGARDRRRARRVAAEPVGQSPNPSRSTPSIVAAIARRARDRRPSPRSPGRARTAAAAPSSPRQPPRHASPEPAGARRRRRHRAADLADGRAGPDAAAPAVPADPLAGRGDRGRRTRPSRSGRPDPSGPGALRPRASRSSVARPRRQAGSRPCGPRRPADLVAGPTPDRPATRHPAVRQLRTVTLRDRPVLPPLRDLPGRLTRRPARSAVSSRTRTQAAPYRIAWKVNDSQASAMNADASEPAERRDAHQPRHEQHEDLAEDRRRRCRRRSPGSARTASAARPAAGSGRRQAPCTTARSDQERHGSEHVRRPRSRPASGSAPGHRDTTRTRPAPRRRRSRCRSARRPGSRAPSGARCRAQAIRRRSGRRRRRSRRRTG